MTIGSPIDLQLVFNATANGLIAVDSHGRIIYANLEAIKTIREAGGAEWTEVLISDVLPMTATLVAKCLETGLPQIGRQVKGKKVQLVLNINPIKKDQRIMGAVCCFQEMQQFEHSALQLESVQRLNKQLKTIFQAFSDGIWVCDHQGVVIDINEASEKLNGVRAKDIIGKSVSQIVDKGLFDKSVTLEVLATKREVSMIQYVSSTEKYLLVTGTPAFNEQGDIDLVVVNERDMTQLRAIQEQLEQSQMEIQRFRRELAEQNLIDLEKDRIVAGSKSMQDLLRVALKLADLKIFHILITGETGTGKGLLAKFIHQKSRRRDKPFIQINCAAIPENLLEAELFGYERGAFTGAREEGKIGLFEAAHEGTLFLDEIGELPLSVQAKILKYLDDKEIMRLGSTRPRKIDCQVIAATNKDPQSLAEKGLFRQDLYYRLNAFHLHIPPLRDRTDCIFDLAMHALTKFSSEYGRKCRISPQGLSSMQAYSFPGNVRELSNLMRKAVVMSESPDLGAFISESLQHEKDVTKFNWKKEAGEGRLPDRLMDVERMMIQQASRACKTTRELARCLGISQPSVVRKCKKHRLGMHCDTKTNRKNR